MNERKTMTMSDTLAMIENALPARFGGEVWVMSVVTYQASAFGAWPETIWRTAIAPARLVGLKANGSGALFIMEDGASHPLGTNSPDGRGVYATREEAEGAAARWHADRDERGAKSSLLVAADPATCEMRIDENGHPCVIPRQAKAPA